MDKSARTTAESGHDDARTGVGSQRGTPGDKDLKGNSQKKLDEKLDEALEETFPTSDPVSVKITK